MGHTRFLWLHDSYCPFTHQQLPPVVYGLPLLVGALGEGGAGERELPHYLGI